MERSGPSAGSHTARAVAASRKTTVGSLSRSGSTLSQHSGTLSRSGSTLSNNGKVRRSANTGPSDKLSRSGSTIGQSDQLNAAMEQSKRRMQRSMQQSEKPSNTGPSGKLSRSGSTIGQSDQLNAAMQQSRRKMHNSMSQEVQPRHSLAAAKGAADLQGIEADFSRTGSNLGDRFDETPKLDRGKSTLETADVVHIEDDTDLFPTEMPSCLEQRMLTEKWVEMIKMVNAQQKVWNSYLWKCCPCVADAKREEVTKQVVAIFKKYGCTVDYTAASMVVFRQVPSKGKLKLVQARSMLGIPLEGNPIHPGASGSQGAKAELTPAESRALRFPRRPSQQSMPEQEVPRSPRSPRRDSKGDNEGLTPAQSRALRFPPRSPSQQSMPDHEQEVPRSPRSPRRDSTGGREELTPAQSRALRFPPRRPSQQSASPPLSPVARAHSMPDHEKEVPRSPRSPRRVSAGDGLTPAESRALRFPKRTQQAMPDRSQGKSDGPASEENTLVLTLTRSLSLDHQSLTNGGVNAEMCRTKSIEVEHSAHCTLPSYGQH